MKTSMTTSTDPEKLAKLSLEELQQQLKTSNHGLSTKEAGDRLLRDGENELSEEGISPIMQFLSHFWGPIAWMIDAAAVLSA